MSSLCFNSTSKDSTFFKQKTTLIQETWPEDIRFSFFMCKNRLSFPLMLFANTFTFNTCKNHPNINQGEACAVKEALTNNRTNKNGWEKARRVSDKQDKIYRSEVHTVLVPFCPFLLWNHFTIHCRKILFQPRLLWSESAAPIDHNQTELSGIFTAGLAKGPSAGHAQLQSISIPETDRNPEVSRGLAGLKKH